MHIGIYFGVFLTLAHRNSTRKYSIDILARLELYMTSDSTLKLSLTVHDGLQTAFLTSCDGSKSMPVTVCDGVRICSVTAWGVQISTPIYFNTLLDRVSQKRLNFSQLTAALLLNIVKKFQFCLSVIYDDKIRRNIFHKMCFE
jgi:hypothetical protein